MSHACLSCGQELARVRARRDGVLGLWVVRCPRCMAASVRRRHPLIVAWRRYRLGARAAGVLALQAFLLFILAIAAGGMIHGIAESLSPGFEAHLVEAVRDRWREDPEWFAMDAYFYAIGIGTVGVGAGVWLRTGLGHWRWWCAWLAWVGVLVLLAFVSEAAYALEAGHARLAGLDMPDWDPADTPRTLRLELAQLIALVSLAALPLGMVGRLAWRRNRVGARRRLLRRRRAARGRE